MVSEAITNPTPLSIPVVIEKVLPEAGRGRAGLVTTDLLTQTPDAPGTSRARRGRVRGPSWCSSWCWSSRPCASMLIGAQLIPVEAVFDSSHPFHGIADVRVDRTLLGLAVGAALGLVGALMQGLTRNPLADPGILGINAGASLAMVLAISVFGFFDLRTYVWFGFAGAAVAMVLVHLVAALGSDGATPMKIAIAGAALTAAVTSWTQAVLLTDGQTIEAFRLWSVGTIGGRDTDVLARRPAVHRGRCRAGAGVDAAASTRSRSATTSPAGSGAAWWSTASSSAWPSCCSPGRRRRWPGRSPSSA